MARVVDQVLRKTSSMNTFLVGLIMFGLSGQNHYVINEKVIF